jgi:RNA-directed DNA polymerase
MIKLNKINLEWGSIDWDKTRRTVRKIQERIFKAKQKGKIQIVRKLQIALINNRAAKRLSVLQVTTLNTGKLTAGVDRSVITNGKQKMALAESITLNGKALPIRRVMIPKPGKIELRPFRPPKVEVVQLRLGIPTIRDRAKQNLAKLALEPEWEAVFEPNSYGFRPGRNCHDAIEAIFLNLHHNRVKHVYDADISKCFDRIEHNALLKKLNTFPQMEQQVRAWLKADILIGYSNRPKDIFLSTAGTPQGGVISPLLANIALHGLEHHLKTYASNLNINIGSTQRGKLAKFKALGVIRYADDFVIIHQNLQILELCIAEAKLFLKNIGLEISEEKSKLRDARESFSFLGFRIILVKDMKRYKVKIMPSNKSCKRLMENIRNTIKISKSISSYNLIKILRPKIIGWANYFRFSECGDTFHRLTNSIFGSIRAWVFRRETRRGRLTVKAKYFPGGEYNFNGKTYKDNWILVGKTKDKKGKIVHNFLPHISWVESRKHVKIVSTNSPYDPSLRLYWAKRLAKHSTYPESLKFLLKRQNFKCPICGSNFNETDHFEIDHIIPKRMGGGDQYDNLNLIHRTCHINKTRSDVERYKQGLSESDLKQLLSPETKIPSKVDNSNPIFDTPSIEEIYASIDL